ncbi:MAG TPA: DUF2842 domain-containing protein [Rhodobacteraceae bacterium]|nr:DUF2842 domain-containing protein [Paracoccaceae bacterium]
MSERPALSYKARRRWSLVILLVGMPLYVVVAVNFTDWLRGVWPTMPWPVELVVFVLFGLLWVLPFKFVFRGVGQADPEEQGRD